ncbi:MAG: DUF421 domain-containing protein [Dehalococcoidia bacterium]|nr:DUF421 domain-containing protein [Dehalococcoidia bacterium]
MWEFTNPWWEIVVRVVVIYAGLLLLLRVAGKRQVGELTPMDLLSVLLLAELVSPALSGEELSLPGALLGAATLIGITVVIAIVSHRSPRIERVLEGNPQVLIQDGEVDWGVMRRERISERDLEVALREHGMLSPEGVRVAVVEPNGRITFVQRDS